MVVADPADGVGFTRGLRDRTALVDDPVIDGVDTRHRRAAGAEDLRHRPAAPVDDRDAVVLLQRHRNLPAGVDAHELRLEILGRVQSGRPGRLDLEFDPASRPGLRCADEVDQLYESGWRLRQIALLPAGWSGFLVALVLDRDRGERSIRADRDGVRLTTEVDAAHPATVRDPHNIDPARRMREVAAGAVDDDQDVFADRRHRGGLIVGMAQFGQRQRAPPDRVRRVTNVEETDAPRGSVRVDDGVAVRRDGRDLGDGLLPRIRSIQVHRIGGQPVIPLRVRQIETHWCGRPCDGIAGIARLLAPGRASSHHCGHRRHCQRSASQLHLRPVTSSVVRSRRLIMARIVVWRANAR
ncbi:hypothetical protein MHAS_00062 [Mycolicibacterium hassiacum DSM 44199]|nr:hypothetical protein MHAS_00062 [Mycolicibacterium hassiacum DSM 44199]